MSFDIFHVFAGRNTHGELFANMWFYTSPSKVGFVCTA